MQQSLLAILFPHKSYISHQRRLLLQLVRSWLTYGESIRFASAYVRLEKNLTSCETQTYKSVPFVSLMPAMLLRQYGRQRVKDSRGEETLNTFLCVHKGIYTTI